MEWLETVSRGRERFRAPDGKVLVLMHQHVKVGEEPSPDEMGIRGILDRAGCPLCAEMETNSQVCRTEADWDTWHFSSQETEKCPVEGCFARGCTAHLERHAWGVHLVTRCRECGSWEKPGECQACFGVSWHPLCSACYEKHAETPKHREKYAAFQAAEEAWRAEMARRAAQKRLQEERYQRYLQRKAARKR